MISKGYFVDWDGNIRSTDAPGKGYRCEVDTVACYVAVLGKYGTVTHEGSFSGRWQKWPQRALPRGWWTRMEIRSSPSNIKETSCWIP